VNGEIESSEHVDGVDPAPGSFARSDAETPVGRAPRRLSSGALLALIGGAMAVVGALMPWVRVSADYTAFGVRLLSVTTKGTAWRDGWIVLICAILVAVSGILLILMQQRAFQQLWSTLILVFAVPVAGYGIYNWVKLPDRALGDFLASYGQGPVSSTARQVMEKAGLHASLETGLFLVTAGGIIALIAGILALVPALRIPEAPATDFTDAEAA
jgi:hypothetical protein